MDAPTILIAEDHDTLSQSFARLLGSKYHVVGTVTDGRLLVEAADRLRPDVILTDISMPGLNGLEAVGRLKAGGSHARIIVMTMHADADLATQAVRSGASGFVLKIRAHDELERAIDEALQGRTYVSPGVTRQV